MQKRLANRLILLGKGEIWRGLAVACAGLLTAAGLLAPHLDEQILASVLLAAGAALAFIAGSRNFTNALNERENVKPSILPPSSTPAPHANAQRVRQYQGTLLELWSCEGPRPAVSDAACWRKLTHRMSHELRTPLNAVIGFSELMESEVYGPLGCAQYHDYVRSIQASGRTLLKSAEDALAITNLLTRSTLRGRESHANVRAAIDEMLAFHQAETRTLSLDIAFDLADAAEISGEAQTLRQILINLMSESIETAAPDGAVAIHCSASADEVFVTLAVEGIRQKTCTGEDSFSMVLARTLVQLSQGRLIERNGGSDWSVTAIFPRTTQRDFFATR